MATVPMQPTAILTNGKTAPIKATVSRSDRDDGALYAFSVRNVSPGKIALGRVRLFFCDLGPEVEIFRNGFYMPSDGTGFYLLRAGQPLPAARCWPPEWIGERDFVSHSLVILEPPRARKKLLLGFTTFQAFHGCFVFQVGSKRIRFSAWLDTEGIPLKAGEEVVLEELMVAEDADFQQVLERYTDFTAAKNGARVIPKTVTGWSDWQYYREEKAEADVLRSVAVLGRLKRAGLPLEHIILDGGWCRHASEWLKPCAKFPSGMKKLSRVLRRRGFRLGLWLAPYITNVKTAVVKRHPDWLVKDGKTGHLLKRPSSNVGPCHVIDFTVPEAQEWLRRIVRTMVRDWKIGYLKLDGPCLAHYRGGRFRDSSMTTYRQVRRTLEIIREECGERVIVEGEGIYGPSIGFVDTQRTTQDNHPAWYNDQGGPQLKENMKDDLLSAFLHRRFWHNHRENIILRDFGSPFHAGKAEHPDSKEPIMPVNEMLLQLSATSMAGGALLLTDPMDELIRNPKAMERVGQLFPNHESQGCIPLDTFRKGRQPSLYCLPVRRPFEEWRILGVFNWEDLYRDFLVPLGSFSDGAWHAFEFWTESYLGSHAGLLPVKDVPPHACRLIALRRREDHPQFLGDNIHLFQGAVEIADCAWDGKTLSLTVDHFRQEERKLFLWHPAEYALRSVQTNARDHLVDDRRKNLTTVHFNGRRRTDFAFTWQRQ